MTEVITNADIFREIETWAPKQLAYDWDHVGLQVGSHQQKVKKVLISLDVLESVVDEAIELGVNLIIAHHPLLFKPLKKIDVNTPQGRTIAKLIKHEISVYAAHTNLDIAEGGVNDLLCQKLQIKTTDHVVPVTEERLYKLKVFVPLDHAREVRDAISQAGAGHIGNYSHCTFQTKGQGTFKPLQGTNPYIGKIDEVEYVDEYKIETIVQESILAKVIQAMIEAHPYEEVAYDIFPLHQIGKSYGLGRIGQLPNQMTVEQLALQVKQVFSLDHVRVIGKHDKNINQVAVIGGSGEKYIHAAKMKGADVLITGDMTFHQAQIAKDIGLVVIDAGHYIEEVMKEAMQAKLASTFSNHSVEFIISKVNTNPFTCL